MTRLRRDFDCAIQKAMDDFGELELVALVAAAISVESRAMAMAEAAGMPVGEVMAAVSTLCRYADATAASGESVDH